MKNQLNLQDITLITVTSVNIEAAVNALVVSSEHCRFGSIKLLSPSAPNRLPSFIQHQAIKPIDIEGYSKFMIEDLYQFIDTRHCLIIQPDGFVINPSAWKDEYLNYDYVGAPWPEVVKMNNYQEETFSFSKNRVGNGGFSLRSKKLLDVCAKIDFGNLNYPIQIEDMLIGHFLYEHMLESGIQFAPLDLANSFSIESYIEGLNNDLSSSFGFHGKHWLSNNYLQKLALESEFSNEFSSLLKNTSGYAKQLNSQQKVGRLDPCPCGSSRRYKDCCGKLT